MDGLLHEAAASMPLRVAQPHQHHCHYTAERIRAKRTPTRIGHAREAGQRRDQEGNASQDGPGLARIHRLIGKTFYTQTGRS